MKSREFQVTYGKTFPTKKYASEFLSLTLTVELEEGDDPKQRFHETFRKARETVEAEEWLSKQQERSSEDH